MSSFIIEGGHSLQGEIQPQGAKNEALQVLCATLLTSEPVRIKNVPDIADVNTQIKLLSEIGVKICTNAPGDYTFQADKINLEYLQSDEYLTRCSHLRGSVMFLGPLLARYGTASVSRPGGDKIGRRRLDTHFLGFK
ncbi:MAG: UDP-N-acetylglucosamine 1-carboxyvinyltransferase, partial [Bacteroidaceae bacterium]|nr:UDP-N-acetylglucosamine 1-carboxyvinyltransferase [Bacteroidaceae bacterium]